jgi:ParB family transcriptional regulator, chromosome partitioning protein
VARSDLARSASERYDFLTLDQAAVVAEFEDDDETVKVLVVAAREGRFEHVLQRARDQRAETEARREFVAALEASGLRVIDRPPYDSPVVGLHRLIDAEGDYVDAEAHRHCPGHVVWPQQSYVEVDAHGREVDDHTELTEDQEDQLRSELRWVAVEGCDDPVAHGHRDAYTAAPGNGDKGRADLSEQEREQARAERRRVIENNKAWASAETVRREWLAKFVTRKSGPKHADLFIATALALDAETATSIGGNHIAATWLGCEQSTYGRSTALADTIAEANGARAKMLTLAIILAGYEDRIDRNAWRSPTSEHRRYLRFLADCGYNLAEVEELVIT